MDIKERIEKDRNENPIYRLQRAEELRRDLRVKLQDLSQKLAQAQRECLEAKAMVEAMLQEMTASSAIARQSEAESSIAARGASALSLPAQ